jgi:hypothetical protein
MKYYNIYGRHEEHIVEPIFEDIRGYIQSMAERHCQFIVCVMDERREDDLTQLKVNIKKCGTITYGKLSSGIKFDGKISIFRNHDSMCCIFRNSSG